MITTVLDNVRKNRVCERPLNIRIASLMFSGSISENKISCPLPPPVREWLTLEARYLGITVPALMRHKLINLWENRSREPQQEARR